ncbi:uncharacterized protein Z519_04950 [Cladophialophora bantiana CBS 173.52]|uniref:Cation/H+ exchanger transmembrane domain-containing protein n=1 Tax=Cladophialophora bantiana (strain ATCC 10958 / CBS 173.52 / CDC B-1940 / NIH 8579) TaxID=1442370 RepID=A0A0D2HVP1_CLAB1|nr:uncharacterized protein Z519_04950 [Cladophialophora bantiana CBS 173.52]KIW94970.1 hypothetical protein Z519_04950 [Cladophialophora bantiana CBS 173.52]
MDGLVLSSFNVVCAAFGGFLLSFGLVSDAWKQQFLLSEALISLIAGTVLSHFVGFLHPDEYGCGEAKNIDAITLEFSRLVLAVQLVLAGIQLPSRYLSTAWRSLFYLLGPTLTLMWLSAGLIIWLMLPSLGFVHALAIGACVAPTDPVLSNAVIKGRFAEINTPKPLQKLISAEAGLNDGLGYPFLFFSLYWIKYSVSQGSQLPMFTSWLSGTWGYVVIFSVVYGVVVGYGARKLFFSARRHGFVEEESSLTYVIALSLFVLGTCGILGTDDILACFVAGCTFAWDDQFEQDACSELFWSSVDMLVNISIFIWYGAVAPWASFATNNLISLERLLILGILILCLRRLPAILVMKHKVTEIENLFQAMFVGFFGPIGVSAIFYLMIATEFLGEMIQDDQGMARGDIQYLQEAMRMVVWFLVVSSVVVHGLALPLARVCCRVALGSNRARLSNNEDAEAVSESPSRRFRDYFAFNLSSKESQARLCPHGTGYRSLEEG